MSDQGQLGLDAGAAPRGLGRFGMLIPLYLLLLLVLSLAGTNNRQLLAERVALIAAKESLQVEVALLRREAASVSGPASAAEWAREQGMVPVPEASGATLIAPSAAPVFDHPIPSLELRTVWR